MRIKYLLCLGFAALCFSESLSAQSILESNFYTPGAPLKRIHQALDNPETVRNNHPKIKSKTVYQHQIPAFLPDTNWTYEEFRDMPSLPYSPSSYSLTFDIGQANEFVRKQEHRFFDESTQQWFFSNEWSGYYKEAFLDSTVYRNFSQQGDWISGQRTVYLRNPQPGFTSEYYQETYRIETGWQNNRHVAVYYNADSTVYWSREFLFNENLDDFFLFQLLHTEESDEFDLVESRRYNPEGIETWYKRYTRYDEALRISSQTEYRLNLSKTEAIPSDSTHYHYSEDESTAETFEYSDEMGWQLTHFTRTFSSTITETGETRIDSILSYQLVLLDGTLVPGEISAKTVNLYDGNENLIELAYYNYRTHPDHPLIDKLVYSYELIAGEYLQTEERYLKWDSSINSFYSVWIQTWAFSETGFLFDQSALQFSLYGDTTAFTKTQHIQSGDMLYSVLYDWDSQLKKLIRKETGSFRASAPVIQIASNESDFNYRFIEVSDGYPAVFNNGPIQIALGDTLNFSIKAFNPDLSVPDLVIENMPASATLNQENNQFFWIVDDLHPAPMIYTVTDHGLSYSTSVSFISGELAVQNETNQEVPGEIQLHQNYPNPFNPSTTISYELPENSGVRVQIFDILGRQVAELVHQTQAAGSYSVSFNARALSSGVYFYRLSTPQYSATKRMLLLK